jgi:hypothetical protein
MDILNVHIPEELVLVFGLAIVVLVLLAIGS